MEVKISEVGTGNILTLSSNWKGYSFNENTDSWIKDNNLYKDEKNNLYPFCSEISINSVTKIFETCPINDNNILIIRGNINGAFVVAYILVGSVDIKSHKFETKLLMD
jgi:hypothetical protein